MNKLDIAALRAVAEAATQEPWAKKKEIDYGPHTWTSDKDAGGQVQLVRDVLSKGRVAHVYNHSSFGLTEAITVHIATFDPPTVLALLDELREKEQDVDREL